MEDQGENFAQDLQNFHNAISRLLVRSPVAGKHAIHMYIIAMRNDFTNYLSFI